MASPKPSRWCSMAFFVPLNIALLWYIFFASPFAPSISLATTKNTQLSPVAAPFGEDKALFVDIIEDTNMTLFRRDEYACKKGSACKQYACCRGFNGGDTGECGLGPTWCGVDCDSQCDARAKFKSKSPPHVCKELDI